MPLVDDHRVWETRSRHRRHRDLSRGARSAHADNRRGNAVLHPPGLPVRLGVALNPLLRDRPDVVRNVAERLRHLRGRPLAVVGKVQEVAHVDVEAHRRTPTTWTCIG